LKTGNGPTGRTSPRTSGSWTTASDSHGLPHRTRSQRGAVQAQRVDVARRSADVGDIEIDHRRCLVERNEGIPRVGLAAQQTALLGVVRHEQQRPPRTGLYLSQRRAAPSMAATPDALSSAPLYIESPLAIGPMPL